MKSIKMIGLAAVAALALTATAGAGTAAATVLCKTATSPCGEIFPAATVIQDPSLTGGSAAMMKNGLVAAECNGQRFEASITNAGSSTKPVSLANGLFAVDLCAWPHTITFTSFGSSEIHFVSEGEGVVTAEGIQFTYDDLGKGFRCWYATGSSPYLGTFTAGTEPTIQVNATFELTKGSLLQCGAKLQWTGEFQLTVPAALYIAES